MRRGRMSRFFQKDVARLRSTDREVVLLTVGHPSHFGQLASWSQAVAALRRNLGRSFLPNADSTVRINVPAPRTKPSAAKSVPIQQTSVRQTLASPHTVYEAVRQPPGDFGYQPILDFWQELSKLGPTSIEGMHRHMLSLGWVRPSGKPLTYAVMRIDMVSMAKHGFIRRVSG